MNQSDELRRAIELLRTGKQLMDGVLAEYHEARQDERPFVIGCQEWMEEAQALLLAADRQAAAESLVEKNTMNQHQWKKIAWDDQIERLSNTPAPAERSVAKVEADEIVGKLEALRSRMCQRGDAANSTAELDAIIKGTFSLRASGTPIVGILKEGIQTRKGEK